MRRALKRVAREGAVHAARLGTTPGVAGATARVALATGDRVLAARRAAAGWVRSGRPRTLDRLDRLLVRTSATRAAEVEVAACRLTSGLDVSLAILPAVARSLPAPPTGLALLGPGGAVTVVGGRVVGQHDGVRIAARLPADLVAREPGLRLALLVGGVARPVRVASRGALHHRLSLEAYRNRGWPGRVLPAAGGRLRVAASPPPAVSVRHRVSTTADSMVLEWFPDVPDASDGALRFVRETDGALVECHGSPSGGARVVTVPASCFEGAETSWLVEVHEGGRWLALGHTLGEHPRLRRLAELPWVVTHPAEGRTEVRWRYSPGNQLTVQVRGGRGPG